MNKHYIVKGKVQGVWFRQSTKEKANSLNITGWVKNLENGDVEVCAFGTDADIAELESWLWRGPEYARVDTVIINECNDEIQNGFEIRR